jgi:hypothetical protein
MLVAAGTNLAYLEKTNIDLNSNVPFIGAPYVYMTVYHLCKVTVGMQKCFQLQKAPT